MLMAIQLPATSTTYVRNFEEDIMRFLWVACKHIVAPLVLLLSSGLLFAQSNPVYMQFGSAKALYYKPDGNAKPRVAFLITHRTSNFLQHLGCSELPKRGFAALCMNTRYDNNELIVDFDRIALDVKAGVEFLRKQPGIERVLFLAHSGGGPTLSFYQAVAENGVAFCQDPRKIATCRSDLAGLPRADGIAFADAHPGVPVILLRSLNGAVLNETPKSFDPFLDPYSVANGYNATGSSNYPADFQGRYFAAQSRRMNALIDSALGRQAAVRAGAGPYPDNDLFPIPHGGNPGAGPGGASQLHSLDTKISLRRTNSPRKLLKNDGTISEQIITSVSPVELNTKDSTNAFDTGTKLLTLRSFLTTQAIRSTNSLDGIDHCSALNDTVCAVGSISVPIMIAGMGGYLFIRDSEEEYEAAKSADKDLVFIEGATHGFTPCANCGVPAATYSNSVKNLFDYIANWAKARYTTSVAIEYQRLGTEQYFLTNNSAEVLALDAGTQSGWVRTGQELPVYPVGDRSAATRSPVCRLYGSPEAGHDTHVYSASPGECAAISGTPGGWIIETAEAFVADLPDATSGLCPSGSQPIYGLSNNKPDRSQRFTTSAALRDQLVAAGWVKLGAGPGGVAMCGPSA